MTFPRVRAGHFSATLSKLTAGSRFVLGRADFAEIMISHTPSTSPSSTRKTIAALALAVAIVASACASSTADDSSSAAETGAAEASTAALVSSAEAADGSVFDASLVHTIDISFDDDEYTAMLETYITTSEKDWIEATVTIDGTTYEQVGLRLKGNSSLRGVSADADPEELPWLIRFDKYVDGQNHEGYADLVVRSNNTESALNEAVALELLGDAGLATQQAIETAFSVNDSDAVLRLVIEHPDDVWMEMNFGEGGALYKAESTGDYTYRGDDEASYDEVFDQEAGKDNTDLTPLIEFLDFINNADDETFSNELATHLDVDAFATYLAMMDLVDNFDDIDGPGNNSYLYYDAETEQFTVVPWDLNLAFGVQNGDQGGGAGVGGAGVGGPGVGGAGVGGARPEPGVAEGIDPRQAPGGVEGEAVPGVAGQQGGPNGSNVLAERFKADAEFAALYEEATDRLEAELFTSGHAADVVAEWTSVLETVPELIDADTIETETSTIVTAGS